MDINIYSKYVVVLVNESTYIGETGEFKNLRQEHTSILDGGEIIDLLHTRLADDWVQAVKINNGEIYIDAFNALTGETEKNIYTIKEELR